MGAHEGDLRLDAIEAAILLAAIDSEVHFLGWLDNAGWSEDQFFAAVEKLRAISSAFRDSGMQS